MFSCRTWDPVKKKISAMDCPLLCTEFRSEVDRLVLSYPFPVSVWREGARSRCLMLPCCLFARHCRLSCCMRVVSKAARCWAAWGRMAGHH